MVKLYELALTDNGENVLFVQQSPIHGRGLFTDRGLTGGHDSCRRLGLRHTLSLRDMRAIIGIDGLDPANKEDTIFKSINHSCHPNAIFTNGGLHH